MPPRQNSPLSCAASAEAACNRQHRAQVRDHADDPPLGKPEMKGAIATVRVKPPSRPINWQNRGRSSTPASSRRRDFDASEGCSPGSSASTTNGDRLLPVTAKPFRQPSLPNEPKHLLFGRARQIQRAVERRRIDGGATIRNRRAGLGESTGLRQIIQVERASVLSLEKWFGWYGRGS
jgi:hypothetical protein